MKEQSRRNYGGDIWEAPAKHETGIFEAPGAIRTIQDGLEAIWVAKGLAGHCRRTFYSDISPPFRLGLIDFKVRSAPPPATHTPPHHPRKLKPQTPVQHVPAMNFRQLKLQTTTQYIPASSSSRPPPSTSGQLKLQSPDYHPVYLASSSSKLPPSISRQLKLQTTIQYTPAAKATAQSPDYRPSYPASSFSKNV